MSFTKNREIYNFPANNFMWLGKTGRNWAQTNKKETTIGKRNPAKNFKRQKWEILRFSNFFGRRQRNWSSQTVFWLSF